MTVCVSLVGHHQQHVARLAFDERRDERASRAFKEIALPMPRHGAILDLCGALSNRHRVENLALSRMQSSDAARMTKMVLTA